MFNLMVIMKKAAKKMNFTDYTEWLDIWKKNVCSTVKFKLIYAMLMSQ